MTVEVSRDPRTGSANGEVATTETAEVPVVVAVAAEAAPTLARTSPAERRAWSYAVADALENASGELVDVADAETGLGETRLAGEVARVAGQLRFYADVAVEGSYLGVTIDRATDTSPSLARVRVPLGPVAVFGASNFPFAFGLLGNDTASALAAGCPVVAKGHPAHPRVSARLAAIATAALAEAGAPDGTFAMVSGFDAGVALVREPRTAAVAFTGSQRGGLALWRAAAEREVVIPVFAEMGTVNPAVVTAAATARLAEIASGFVGSFTLGTGQFCTKPGLLLVPAGYGAARVVGDALEASASASAPAGWSLTEQIATSAAAGVAELTEAGAGIVAQVAGPDAGWSVASTVLSVPIDALRAGSRLLEECFGPVALVAEYDGDEDLTRTLHELQGSLAASVMSGGADDSDVPRLLTMLAAKVGRVAVDDWPTGVAYTWAQHHGGPWPSTSVPSATSVGAAALDRFVRPVAYQSVPDHALPTALQGANPWRLPRRVDGVPESVEG
ncbi:aldehyde dehydrogenase family protein [Solicola gregarius]|uniref:Aldehyde dehydrogenase family protein n=1 Tax=Solicola gregarius TaxID=2908642 RepID=A0AA46YM24_9ACTN|nr:aldehyde dehydrogenase family protein [Solicola gregarius]UYM07575.1 aldehyde dehydrogenase family protein [Solicola gregarius]